MARVVEPEQIPYTGDLASEDKNNIRSLTNPLKEDFTFHYGGKAFTVESGKTKQFVEYIALHGAKHLAEQILFEKGVERYPERVRVEVMEEIVDQESKKQMEQAIEKEVKPLPKTEPVK